MAKVLDSHNGTANDHSGHQPVTEETARRLEQKLDLLIDLLCSDCRSAALLRLHPKPAPIPGLDDRPAQA